MEICQRDLPIANLPDHWVGRTLVQLSDIHVGYRVSDHYLISSFDYVRSLRPDLVVLTGDYVSLNKDRSVPWSAMERVLSKIPKGQLGTVGILGNHDYGWGWEELTISNQITDLLNNTGVTMLRNDVTSIDGLQIIGMDDVWGRRIDIAGSLSRSNPNLARLVLCHNPDGCDLGGWGDYHGWVLSGHTHGGQCKPPFLPPPMLPVKNRRYTAGEFALTGKRSLYINRGLGHLTKARFNCRPEITVFRLVQA